MKTKKTWFQAMFCAVLYGSFAIPSRGQSPRCYDHDVLSYYYSMVTQIEEAAPVFYVPNTLSSGKAQERLFNKPFPWERKNLWNRDVRKEHFETVLIQLATMSDYRPERIRFIQRASLKMLPAGLRDSRLGDLLNDYLAANVDLNQAAGAVMDSFEPVQSVSEIIVSLEKIANLPLSPPSAAALDQDVLDFFQGTPYHVYAGNGELWRQFRGALEPFADVAEVVADAGAIAGLANALKDISVTAFWGMALANREAEERFQIIKAAIQRETTLWNDPAMRDAAEDVEAFLSASNTKQALRFMWDEFAAHAGELYSGGKTVAELLSGWSVLQGVHALASTVGVHLSGAALGCWGIGLWGLEQEFLLFLNIKQQYENAELAVCAATIARALCSGTPGDCRLRVPASFAYAASSHYMVKAYEWEMLIFINFKETEALWKEAVDLFTEKLDLEYGLSCDRTPPEVVSRSCGTDAATLISIGFSEDMDPSTMTGRTVTVSGSRSGAHVCGFSYDPSAFELTLTPEKAFRPGETVTVVVESAVRDLSGNPLSEDDLFTFQIEAAEVMSNIDVVLVIDCSGSMDSGNKMERAKSAASVFAGLMQAGDGLAVVSFSDNMRTNFPMTVIAGPADVSRVQNAISRISAAGGTSIGGGMRFGQAELDKGSVNHPHAMLLLTDGQETSSQYPVLNELARIPDATDIYTIGIGLDADQMLLNRIAGATGGTYHFSPSAGELQQIYMRIRGQITGQATVATFSGTLSQGQTAAHTCFLDDGVTQALFALGFGGSDIDLELVRPDGSVINPDTSSGDPLVSFQEGGTYDFITVYSPDRGLWTIRVKGVDLPVAENYEISLQAHSGLSVVVQTDKPEYSADEPILISALVNDAGTLLPGASVSARVDLPGFSTESFRLSLPDERLEASVKSASRGGKIQAYGKAPAMLYRSSYLSLFDDGMHGDGSAGDGLYANVFNQTPFDGSYFIRVKASGTTQTGIAFEREGTISTYVNPASYQVRSGGLGQKTVYSVLVHTQDTNVLFAGTDGYGLFKTTDQGATWELLANGLTDDRIFDLAADPADPGILYAATGNKDAGKTKGLFKTTDGGLSWAAKKQGLPAAFVFTVEKDPISSGVVYAGTNGYGVYKTTDGGEHWTAANNGVGAGKEIHGLAVHPANPGTVFAGTKDGLVYKSVNSAGNWKEIRLPGFGSYLFGFAFDPADPDRIFIPTNGGGIFQSTDCGESWSPVNQGLNDLFVYELAANRSGKLFAGTSRTGIFNSPTGQSWAKLSGGGSLTTVHSIAFSNLEPHVIYAGTQSGVYRIVQPVAEGTVSSPILYPPAGTYGSAVQVTLFNTTPGSSIHYTLDGSVPSEFSALYTAPFEINQSMTISARAFKHGLAPSTVSSGTYFFPLTLQAPVFDPQPGNYTPPVELQILSEPGASVRYTLDGSMPGQASSLYEEPIVLENDAVVSARSFQTDHLASPVSTGRYTFSRQLALPVFFPGPGLFQEQVSVSLSAVPADAEIRFTLDGSEPTALSALYSGPLLLTESTLIKAIALKSGWTASPFSAATFVVQKASSVDLGGLIPDDLVLFRNAPNPFNSDTRICYGLPASGRVSLRIYDVLGRETRTLADQMNAAGYHVALWDGRDNDGSEASSGIYICRLNAGGKVISYKLMMLR